MIRGPEGERVVDMREFHRGPYETAVGDGEMLDRDPRRRCTRAAGSAYEKVERRVGDWAVAAAGAVDVAARTAIVERAGIALTAVGADVTSAGRRGGARRQGAVGGAVRRGRRIAAGGLRAREPTSAARRSTSGMSCRSSTHRALRRATARALGGEA